MAHAAEQLVGRPAELDAFDGVARGTRAGTRRPRSSSSASRASGRPACSPSSPIAPTRAGTSFSPGPRRSSSAICRSGSSSTRSTSTPRGSTHDASSISTTRRAPSSRTSSRACPAARRRRRAGAPGRALPHPPRRARAAGACSRRRKPLVLILDDLHWADSGSIELLGALLRRPPSAPVLLAMALAAAPDARTAWRPRSSVRTERGGSSGSSSGR